MKPRPRRRLASPARRHDDTTTRRHDEESLLAGQNGHECIRGIHEPPSIHGTGVLRAKRAHTNPREELTPPATTDRAFCRVVASSR
jgi:hypothetical protein